MSYRSKILPAHLARAFAAAALIVLAACSSSKDPRREPAPLVDFKPVLEVRQAWKASVGKTGRYLFSPTVVDGSVYAAGANGTVARFDAGSGHTEWRTKLDRDLSAGVGADGQLVVVGSPDGTVSVLSAADGKQQWTTNVGGEILSAPLVGHGYVMVRTIDGRITAFTAQTGEQKWEFRNSAVPLNLRATEGMIFAGDHAVLAGFPGGVMAAINIDNGEAFWQTPVSYPQGTTEVERINDVSGTPTLAGRMTCAVTFQGRIGCFEAESGRQLWEQPYSGYTGLSQDEQSLVATDDWSFVSDFDALNGNRLWQNKSLRSRAVSRPLVAGRTVVVGDYKGFVHFLSRDTGDFIARLKTDGSAITAPPVFAGQTIIVQTHDGDLYAFQPE